MAHVKEEESIISLPRFQAKLGRILTSELKKVGIEPKIQTQRVPGTKLCRVMVFAKQFDHLRPSERQDLVWRIVAQHFQPSDQLRISMILTLAPNE